MRKPLVFVLLSLPFALFLAAQQTASDCKPITGEPRDLLQALKDGNIRYAGDRQTKMPPLPQHWNQSVACAKARAADPQKPFAVILSCSDSRVPPEVAFDLGVGDLFVVREPGNTATPVVLGSIYYGVQVLKANLVVVMGHRRCGAVKAAFCPNPGVFPEIWNLIHPAVHKKGWATDQCPDSINQDQWDAVARDNVFNTTQKVKEDLMSRGITNPNVVPAYYDVENGEIKLPLLVKH